MAETKEPPLSGPASGSRSNGAAVQASTGTVKQSQSSQSPTPSTPRAPPRQKYRMPLPLRTFPLPTFYPSNPVSLVHLAVAWVQQVLLPPADEPATVHTGVWSSATRSVHVTDPKSMNDLWSQGFYGKGSLSRSEPNWLNREKARQAAALVDASSSTTGVSTTSEQRTNKRREERADTKWERGRTELEAIEQRRREEEAAEAEAAAAAEAKDANAKEEDSLNGHADVVSSLPSPPPSPTPIIFKAPVGPLELLALPNSEAELRAAVAATAAAVVAVESTHLNGSASKIETEPKPHVNGSALQQNRNGTAHSKETTEKTTADMNGSAEPADAASPSVSSSATRPIEPLKRQKSVRFSPTVESTTFLHSDPPSPNHGARSPQTIPTPTTTMPEIVNKEHLQLAPEEAFFLSYGIGALQVVDECGRALSTKELLAVCRASRVATSSSSSTLFSSTSSSPSSPSSASPRMVSSSVDDFLLHYAVYHHFRSLGWVPRHGIKFGVDWMLYGKGPALDHAEFGVMVIPSFERWPKATKAHNNGRRLSWHWLHSVNRVLSTVFKSLVLVYVDVPPPPEGDVDVEVDDISALLSQYKIREVMVRRWSSNRNRD